MYLVFGEGKETICPHELRKVAMDEFVHSHQESLAVEEVPHLLYVNIALENMYKNAFEATLLTRGKNVM